MISRAETLMACSITAILAACGGDGSADDDPGVDAGPTDEDVCGFGSDRYLPYEVGLTWSYQVTDLGSGERKIKDQSLDEEIVDPVHGSVIVQVTGKLNGSTRSLLALDGDRVVRYVQEDRSSSGAVERTTTYDPGQIRIDESAARTAIGATWEETYAETETSAGGAPVTVTTKDVWHVLGDSVTCTSPLGTFACLHLRRTRTEGGVAVKEFFFARGVGKIREEGDNVVEELAACGR